MTAPAVPDPPAVIKLLADPVRWRLARALAGSDLRVRELAQAVSEPQNLVSYHLGQLRAGGLVASRRSTADGRDTYYILNLEGCAKALASAASALHPGLVLEPPARGAQFPLAGPPRRVLFVCSGNSSRSPMAEGLLRCRAGTRVVAASAGIRPKPLHADAIAVMRHHYRVDIAGHRPTQVDVAAREGFDYVVSLCDRAREACPRFPARTRLIHWSMPDPAGGEGGYRAFERTAAELDVRIGFLLPALDAAAG